MRTWLLIADGVRARLFKVDKKAKKLREIRDFLNPEARLHEKEFAQDSPGRSFDSKGLGRHNMEKSSSGKEKSKEEFAHELVKHLDEKYKTEKINRIVVVAPSKFLGYMNNKFNKVECKRAVTTIAKEMTNLSADEIFKHLKKELLVYNSIE